MTEPVCGPGSVKDNKKVNKFAGVKNQSTQYG